MTNVKGEVLAPLRLFFVCSVMIVITAWLPDFFGGKENVPAWVQFLVVILIGALGGYSYTFVEAFSAKKRDDEGKRSP